MKWTAITASVINKGQVPTLSGIYCFMQSKLVAGLKVETKALYVGQSKNIRSRLLQHLNFDTCHNHHLLVNLASQSKDQVVEFHFIATPKEKLNQLERELITKLNPKHNVLLKGDCNV
jgi:excinuclease UvrABC nuclease subunit